MDGYRQKQQKNIIILLNSSIVLILLCFLSQVNSFNKHLLDTSMCQALC